MKKNKLIFAVICLFLWIVSPVLGQNSNSTKLKAVLVVGHLEASTQGTIKEIDKVADLLSKNGITVYKFYDKEANWNEIIKVAKDCSFFIYSGHGSNMGENGNAGGICITSIISSAEIMKSLVLKENALVLFSSVCNGAGSSAGDERDIGIAEAKKRVGYYAEPFFKIGAAAYYADNYTDGVYNFLSDFLSGLSLKKAYLNSTEKWTKVEFEEAFSRDNTKSISVASSPGGGVGTKTSYVNGVKKQEKVVFPKSYVVAYVGKISYSIKDMK